MRMVVHLKDLLLLGCQVLRLVLSIHNGKSHRAWHKNVVVLAIGSCLIWCLHKVILIGSPLFDGLKLLWVLIWGVFVTATVVSNVSSSILLIRNGSFLVVAVQILDVQ